MDEKLLARRYACPNREKMKWQVEPGLAQCHGCSRFCGMGWPSESSTPKEFASDVQPELFALQP